jgi:hypothetical protein
MTEAILYDKKPRLGQDDAALVIRNDGTFEIFSGCTDPEKKKGEAPFAVIAVSTLVVYMVESRFIRMVREQWESSKNEQSTQG